MTIRLRLFATVTLVLCVLGFPGEVVRASHVNCGDVITTDTVLDADLTCAGPGLIIGADNITLDLNGHTLTGPGLDCPPTCSFFSVPDGVRVDRHNGVTITNGYITGFVYGIRLIGASHNVIDHVVTTDSTFNGIALSSGLGLSGSDNNVVTHCDSSNNTVFGIIMNDGSDDNVVQHCALSGNQTGVFIGGGRTGAPSFRNHLAQNGVRNNGLGIHFRNADENLVEWNVVEANDLGILISEGADRNVVQHNIVNHSGRDGLLVDRAITLGFTEPEDNEFVRNRLHGNGTSGDPGARDISDHTTGDGTLGTENGYDGNQCGISFPDGLCLMLNQAPTADAGPDQVVECTAGGTSVTLDGTSSSDPDGDMLSYSWSDDQGVIGSGPVISVTCPGTGSKSFSLTVDDGKGGTDTDTVQVTVVDTTAPAISTASASPTAVWPPNHRMVPVAVSVSVADACDPSATCAISSVASNEPLNGLGDGDTEPDWEITGPLTVNVRAERSGNGTGRVYTITIECTDASGNSSTKTVTVIVSHNGGR